MINPETDFKPGDTLIFCFSHLEHIPTLKLVGFASTVWARKYLAIGGSYKCDGYTDRGNVKLCGFKHAFNPYQFTLARQSGSTAPDPVNAPSHYLGNAVKYISRAGKKNDNMKEDLQKAVWYLNREINKL
jgi:hypothetical protein